jgi:homoserine kinase
MNEIKIFTPATIANVSCGFDILGLCLDSVGDEMVIRKSDEKGVKITKIIGQDLPMEADQNVAGVAVMALLNELQSDAGFEIEIYKNIKPGSGIGSSAASSAGAVFAVNELLGKPFTNQQLVAFAMQGEKLASGTAHADNVAPALFGGCTMVTSYDPLNIIKIDAPEELYATVIHPQIEVKTADSRSVLKQKASLKTLVTQMGHFGGLIAGLYTEDYELMGRSLQDEIIEPNRSILIPAFDKVKEICKVNGALGSGISGSGPSIFALSRGEATAKKVAQGMAEVYEKIQVDFDVHISKVNPSGVRILNIKE